MRGSSCAFRVLRVSPSRSCCQLRFDLRVGSATEEGGEGSDEEL